MNERSIAILGLSLSFLFLLTAISGTVLAGFEEGEVERFSKGILDDKGGHVNITQTHDRLELTPKQKFIPIELFTDTDESVMDAEIDYYGVWYYVITTRAIYRYQMSSLGPNKYPTRELIALNTPYDTGYGFTMPPYQHISRVDGYNDMIVTGAESGFEDSITLWKIQGGAISKWVEISRGDLNMPKNDAINVPPDVATKAGRSYVAITHSKQDRRIRLWSLEYNEANPAITTDGKLWKNPGIPAHLKFAGDVLYIAGGNEIFAYNPLEDTLENIWEGSEYMRINMISEPDPQGNVYFSTFDLSEVYTAGEKGVDIIPIANTRKIIECNNGVQTDVKDYEHTGWNPNVGFTPVHLNYAPYGVGYIAMGMSPNTPPPEEITNTT